MCFVFRMYILQTFVRDRKLAFSNLHKKAVFFLYKQVTAKDLQFIDIYFYDLGKI